MSFAEEDACRESARSIMAECSARVSHAMRQEMARVSPDEERIAGLRLVGEQLRREREAVCSGNPVAIARARFFYGLMLKQVHYLNRRSSPQ